MKQRSFTEDMKSILKYTLLLLGSAALLLSGCELEQAPEWDEPAVLYARIEGADPGTKTSYDSEVGKFIWSEGDQIAVHFSNGSYVTGTVAASTGEVSVQLPSGATRDFYAVYPATAAVAANYGNPTLQITYPADYDISDIVSGSSTTRTADFSPCPMVAVNDVDSDVLCLYHVGGLVRITVPAAAVPAATRQVRVTFDKDVTGTYTVSNPATTEPTVTTGGSASGNVVTFTLAPAGGSVGSLSENLVLNVPVPCGTYEGFTVECVDQSGAVTASEVCTRSLTLARHHGRRISISPGVVEPVTLRTPLTIEPKGGAATITITNPNGATIQWSIDGDEQSGSNANLQIAVPAGQSVALYQADPTKSVGNISLSDPCYVYGNVMSLVAGEDFISQTALGCRLQFSFLFGDQENVYNHDEKDIVLPATTLTDYCYESMFFGCKLTRAPALPAKTLAEGCYNYMFFDCFSLTTPPELPATTLADYCYAGMFYGCTSLTTAPALPVENLTMGCYAEMFSGCTSLTTAPALPATTLTKECYMAMFSGCRSLTTVPADYLHAEKLAEKCYSNMFAVTGLTTAPNLPVQDLAVQCYDGMFSGSALTTPPVLPAKTLVKGCYQVMFSECKNLTTLPELHAETLAENCYLGMFTGCPQLTTVPADYLPWRDLEPRCYEDMFKSCQNLTTAPNLPAENLAERCYFNMFSQCTSLTTAPALSAETLARECYRGMFEGCSSLTTAPVLPAKTLAEGCYGYMFQGCTSLTTAPVLPAKTLVTGCYVGMFWKCTSLSFIECHATNTSNNYVTCLERWTENVSSTGTFRKGSGVIWLYGTNAIPIGWTTYEI